MTTRAAVHPEKARQLRAMARAEAAKRLVQARAAARLTVRFLLQAQEKKEPPRRT